MQTGAIIFRQLIATILDFSLLHRPFVSITLFSVKIFVPNRDNTRKNQLDEVLRSSKHTVVLGLQIHDSRHGSSVHGVVFSALCLNDANDVKCRQ